MKQLSIVDEKINLQTKYLENINEEIGYISTNIDQSSFEIGKLHRQLDTLKAQYSRSVVYTYKSRSTYDFLSLIFSSISFNDAIKRIAYLKSYRSYREQQVNNIVETQRQLEKRRQLQISQVTEKKLAIQNQAKQVQVLQSQKNEKDEALNELRSKEKELKEQIAARQKRDQDLKKTAVEIISRELKKVRAKDRSEKAASNSIADITNTNSKKETRIPKVDYLNLNAEDKRLNTEFPRNKGILPWPVDNGFPTIHFGPYEVPGIKGVIGNNPGVTISASAGATVKSVFSGEVAAIANLGDGMMVTIRHGKYFTVYSNLNSVNVSKGMTIGTGQAIGKVGQSDDGNGGQIDFILMIESKNVNPEAWLQRR